MIYLLFGQDINQSQKRLRSLIDGFQKRSQTAVFRLEETEFLEARFEEFLKAQGLFDKKCLIVGKRLLSDNISADFILERLAQCRQSENIFIFWEENLASSVLTRLKKRAHRIEEFPIKTEKQLKSRKGHFNIFSVADAFAWRQKRKTWILFQKALAAGITPEEIFWKLVWQIKALLLAKLMSSVPALTKSTGWKPFFAGKVIRASANFSEPELKNYSRQLVELYHRTYYRSDAFNLGVEKFILKL